MRVFISGGITGIADYRSAFLLAQKQLEAEGHDVMSPTTLPDDQEWSWYIPKCFEMIDRCDAVYFLDGWEKSRGARMEYDYATAKHKKTRYGVI